MPSSRQPIAALIFLLVLSACSSPTEEPALPPSPTTTPVYELSLPVEAVLVRPAPDSGEWLVLGIAGEADQAIEDPHVLIVLRDGAGGEIARRTIEIPVDPLPSASAWPFREPFRPATPPTSVEATLLGNPAALGEGPDLTGRVLGTFLDARGTTVALGALANRGPTEAIVERLGLLGRDTTGEIREVLDVDPATARLASEETVPFLAPLPRGSEALEWEVYPIARAVDGRPLTVEIVERRSDQDDQGNPFVTAVVRNQTSEPLWVVLTGVVADGERWLAGDSLSLPLPLAPGERAPFSLRLPGVSLPPEGHVEWLIVTRTSPAEASPVTVPSEVTGYEAVGSTLFLRVLLTAGAEMGTRYPSAQATLTGDDGQLVSAGWGVGPPALAPGETAVITLALPLPSDFDLTLGQLDVQGGGLP
ncbi:MAG: hypothetical protein HW404_388 [Anaerolineales bacterium]|nr:hypothetical protein [Anaerolineales bacterium]